MINRTRQGVSVMNTHTLGTRWMGSLNSQSSSCLSSDVTTDWSMNSVLPQEESENGSRVCRHSPIADSESSEVSSYITN